MSHFFDDAKKDPLNFKIISTSLDQNDIDTILDPVESVEDEDEVISFGGLDGENELDSIKVEPSTKLISLDDLRLERGARENVILVLGSEGEGVSKTISRCADHRVVIPPQLRMD